MGIIKEFDTNVPKRKRGKPLTFDEKLMILRVYSKCYQERKNDKFIKSTDPYKRTSDYTGVGRRQIVEIVRDYRENNQVSPQAVAGNKINHPCTISTSVEPYIRAFIFNRHREGAAVNANHIFEYIQDNLKLDIPKQTIRNHIKRMGFQYCRTRTKPRSLRETPHIKQQRHTYLHDIKKFRKQGYRLIYLDESFLHHYHGNQFSWFDGGDYLERPRGKGRRWCFIHAMHEKGLLSNTLYIFEAKKSTGDYHNMFNSKHFLEWWETKLMPCLDKKCLVIVDRATYHMVPEEQISISTMRKAELQDWLSKKNIKWEKYWLRPRLQTEVENNIDKTPIIEKLGIPKGYKVLFLPVHHPELNPIEYVWAIVKNECGRLLRSGVKFKDVKENLKKAFEKISPETCRKLYEKVIIKEEEYWKLDEQLDCIE